MNPFLSTDWSMGFKLFFSDQTTLSSYAETLSSSLYSPKHTTPPSSRALSPPSKITDLPRCLFPRGFHSSTALKNYHYLFFSLYSLAQWYPIFLDSGAHFYNIKVVIYVCFLIFLSSTISSKLSEKAPDHTCSSNLNKISQYFLTRV